MLSIANLLSLPNCVVRSESAFAPKLCGLQRTNFCCQIVVPTANQFSLLDCSGCSESVMLSICVACSEPILLLNCIVRSESIFAAEF
jgi:hypothetical protein